MRLLFTAIFFLLTQPSAAQNDPQSGYSCHVQFYFAYGIDGPTTHAQACSIFAAATGVPAVYSDGACFNSNNGIPQNPQGCTSPVDVCETSDGSYVEADENGMCPDQCPAPQGGLPGFDTDDCGCSDDDYVPVNNPEAGLVGCQYQPQCPPLGEPFADGCDGPNGSVFAHALCVPHPSEPLTALCDATFNSDGSITFNGGRSTSSCGTSNFNTGEYGCDGAPGTVSGGDDDVGTTASPPPDQSSDDPSDPAMDDQTIDNPDGTTTIIEGESSTDPATGQRTDKTTATTRDSNGNIVRVVTTTTVTNPDGTSSTETVVEEDGETTTTTNNSDGTTDCTGANCEEYGGDGTSSSVGTTAGRCGKPPVCTATPIECAMLRQEWNLQCASTVKDYLDCDINISCTGDPIECAAIELQKRQYCFSRDDQNIDYSKSLDTDIEGIDDGTSYYGDGQGSNEVDVTGVFDSLDTGGLGWSGSCPPPVSFTVLGTTIDLSYDPLCDFLTFISSLIILLGGVHSAYIIVREFV